MTEPSYTILSFGVSRSIPEDHPIRTGATDDGDILLLTGDWAADAPDLVQPSRLAVIVELGDHCLEYHAGRIAPDNLIGFARWRLGGTVPSDLVELVVLPQTTPEALAAARMLFESAGFTASECQDRVGRIVDRLIVPQFNLALNAVDSGLATADDLETALKMGLGYRRGLLEMVIASGLADYHDRTRALFDAYGEIKYAPPRSALIAHQQRSTAANRSGKVAR